MSRILSILWSIEYLKFGFKSTLLKDFSGKTNLLGKFKIFKVMWILALLCINGLIRLALFGKKERELIKSGFGFGLDLTEGMAWQWWHDGYLTDRGTPALSTERYDKFIDFWLIYYRFNLKRYYRRSLITSKMM